MVYEELGGHRGREEKVECSLCGAECESVLWKCPAYICSNSVFREASGD